MYRMMCPVLEGLQVMEGLHASDGARRTTASASRSGCVDAVRPPGADPALNSRKSAVDRNGSGGAGPVCAVSSGWPPDTADGILRGDQMLKKVTVSVLAAIAGLVFSAPHAGAAGCPVEDTVRFHDLGTPSKRLHVYVVRYIVERGWGCKAEWSTNVMSSTYDVMNALAKGDLHIAMQVWGGETWDGMKAVGKVMEPGGFGATADPAIRVVVGLNGKFAEAAGPITAMLSKYRLDADTVDKALAHMKESGEWSRLMRDWGSVPVQATADFLRNSEAVWSRWVPADVAAGVKAALAEDDATMEALREVADRHERASNEGRELSEEEALAKLSGSLCSAFSENDFPSLLTILKNGSRHLLGREVPLEKAYLYTRCDQPEATNCDLLRVVAEDPLVSEFAGRQMILYFTKQTPNQRLLGRIVGCKRDFGFGCVDALEHLDRNANLALQAGNKHRARMLMDFKTFLLRHLNEDDLKHHRDFCRQFLDEPRTCE